MGHFPWLCYITRGYTKKSGWFELSQKKWTLCVYNKMMLTLMYPLVNQHSYGKSPCLMEKNTISMAIFNSYFGITRGYSKNVVDHWKPMRWCSSRNSTGTKNSCHFNIFQQCRRKMLRYRKKNHLRCSFCSPQNLENVSKSWRHIGTWWTNDHCSGLFAIFFWGVDDVTQASNSELPGQSIGKNIWLWWVICCPPNMWRKELADLFEGMENQLVWSWHHQPRFCFRKTSNVRDGLDKEAVCQKSHKITPCFLRFCSWRWSFLYWLVVYLPLWTIWVRQLGWWHSQYMESHKSHVPNHKPVYLVSNSWSSWEYRLPPWWISPEPHVPTFLGSLDQSAAILRSCLRIYNTSGTSLM